MSTRSSKRIHHSFQENVLQSDLEQVNESEKKTRSRRLMKKNVEEFSVRLKNKKRVNYVSYPTDDGVDVDTVNSKEDEGKSTRLLRKNALKEQNLTTSSTVSVESISDVKKAGRTTRRTRKFAEDNLEDVIETQNRVEGEVTMEEARKSKKIKKKNQVDSEQAAEEVVNKKKTKKKKLNNTRRSGSMIVEDIKPENSQINCLNTSKMSVDSFHSAAGSLKHLEDDVPPDMEKFPKKDSRVENETLEENDVDDKLIEKPKGRKTRSVTKLSVNISLSTPNKVVKETRKRKSSAKLESLEDENSDKETKVEPLNNTFNKVSKKHKSSLNDTVTKERVADTTFDKEIIDPTCDVEDLEKRKSMKNSTFDKIETDKINTTYDKNDISEPRKSSIVDTFDKMAFYDEENTTHNKETKIDASSSSINHQSLINTTFEKPINCLQIESVNMSMTQEKSILNTTYETDPNADTKQENKTSNYSITKTTFDKDDLQSEVQSEIHNNDNNLSKPMLSISAQKVSKETDNSSNKMENFDSTFDKDKKLDVTFDKSSKSSLISLDNSNITMDKSDVSRISITSDDSTSNIVSNTTPVLVESSMEESLIMSKLSPKSQAPLTPLKREGTFTKDGPVDESSEPTSLVTPTKRMSLSSPGCTPFHTYKSTSKEKRVLNITRSIEKSRRSSLAEPLPRMTKVMFCSPVNNPTVVLQQTRKVIKSNLKGSNKSFVFQESGVAEPRPGTRKRSFTQSDVDDARTKRKRLTDGLQHSVDRLSRPRTTSASAKIAERVTPKPTTPSKKVPRTKLPNFAALHQKEFDKMESLDECQQRKVKRARQLLTPTGAVTVLERSSRSPRDNSGEPQKSPTEPPKNPTKERKTEKQPKEQAKNPETPVKSLPTFRSLNPGYTRFGFKMNLDMNPFSVPSKTDNRTENGIFNFTSSKAKTILTFSSKKDKDNSKPLKEIKANLRNITLPSRAGTTSERREVAKQAVMREKSFTDRRNVNRNENRTIIKGVRTNRRFELQMRMRNLDL